MAQDWPLISPGQFEHGVRLMEEVGRLLGAWLKTARIQTTAQGGQREGGISRVTNAGSGYISVDVFA